MTILTTLTPAIDIDGIYRARHVARPHAGALETIDRDRRSPSMTRTAPAPRSFGELAAAYDVRAADELIPTSPRGSRR